MCRLLNLAWSFYRVPVVCASTSRKKNPPPPLLHRAVVSVSKDGIKPTYSIAWESEWASRSQVPGLDFSEKKSKMGETSEPTELPYFVISNEYHATNLLVSRIRHPIAPKRHFMSNVQLWKEFFIASNLVRQGSPQVRRL